MGQLAIRQLGYALGAEVSGIDLRQPLDDLAKRNSQEAWHKYLVLVFPIQDLKPAQLIAFSRNFGELDSNDATPYYRDPEHPETGRKALLVSERIRGFVGMTDEESAPILAFLNRHATSLEFTWRHSWSVNDLLMWDNRYLLHIALPDFDQTQTRHMIRCSLLGEESGYYVKDAQEDKDSLTRSVASVS